ncbi:MAG: hypothetical protein A2Z31_05620 [candidate division NC10 bacterium RBG_16_65_8]|nr:MAG: hypothetical protein A2Z31_05620 [candidate division NC10 bacterium RBG_16_65_8]
MRTPLARAAGALFILGWASVAPAGQSARVILTLGNASFINPESVRQATGAEVSQNPGLPLKDVAVLVLANAPLATLPQPIQDGLADYVGSGGAVLITGGSQSFGSGGYKAVSPILPFQIRSDSDWRFISFRPPVALQPGHPILAGVTFLTVGTVNDMNPRPGATEILQSAGGGRAATQDGGGGGGSYLYPLIAELAVGAGRVIGIAFDLNDFAGMRDRNLFVQNTLAYLLATSRTGLGR